MQKSFGLLGELNLTSDPFEKAGETPLKGQVYKDGERTKSPLNPENLRPQGETEAELTPNCVCLLPL